MRYVLAIVAVLALLVLVRVVHLGNTGDYFIVNPDSFYFHEQAETFIETGNLNLYGSGLVTFMAVFGDVDLASMILPVLLAIGIAVLLWKQTTVYYGRWQAVAAMFVFAILVPGIFATSAGMVDRDGLLMLLIIPIMFAILAMHLKDHRMRNLLIYTICCGFMLYFWQISIAMGVICGLIIGYALMRIVWKNRRLRLILALLGAVGAVLAILVSPVYRGSIGELQPLNIIQLAVFVPILLPLVYGIKLALRNQQPVDVFLLIWTGCAFLGACVYSRFLLFAIPPVCILAGVGGVGLWRDYEKEHKGLVALAVLAIIAGCGFGFRLSANTVMPKTWVQTCQYIEDATPEDSTVLTWWDYGWWVYDVAERRPFVNNGEHPVARDVLVAKVYCATSDAEAAALIGTKADYVVFSEREKHVYYAIKGNAEYEGEREDTLWQRALEPGFGSDSFAVVYRDDGIVVLEVKQCKCT